MKILITGATGFIGKELGLKLVRSGHDLVVVSRSRKKAYEVLPFPCEVLELDLTREKMDLDKIQDIDAVIHLMGESVASQRWTDQRKETILQSRKQSTKNLVESFKHSKKLKQIVSTSAIGFYGHREDEMLFESSTAGSDFLSQVCQSWEDEVFQAKKNHPELVISILRIGLVLGRDGGALSEMLFPFRVGVGGNLASGKSWMSWIHLEDVLGMYEFVLNQSLPGIYNAVAPKPVQNKDWTRLLCKELGRPQNLSLPRVALKTLFGEMANVLLSSQKVSSDKITKAGYKFKYEDLQSTFQDLLKFYKNSKELFSVKQYIPRPVNEVFPFFADAKNLESITPPLLNFKIEKVSTDQIKEGTLIDYKLKIRSVPVRWKTVIQEWLPPNRFVDHQLRGPYQLWHHTHEFESLGPGTLMTDQVQYKLPFGYLGWIVASWFVKEDVQKIFTFRRKIIQEKFDDRLKST